MNFAPRIIFLLRPVKIIERSIKFKRFYLLVGEMNIFIILDNTVINCKIKI